MRKDLENELTKFTQEYNKLSEKYSDLDEEYYRVEAEKDCVEEQMNNIEENIEYIKSQLKKLDFEELDDNFNSENDFRNCFIKASLFCCQDEGKDSNMMNRLKYIKITDNQLFACDGYKAIIVNCDNIPKDLQNTFIKYNIREDFENNIEINSPKDYVDLSKVIPSNFKETIINTTINKFKEEIIYDTISSGNYELNLLKYKKVKVAFNKDYMDLIFKIFNKDNFDVMFPDSSVSPILFENDKQKVLLLPVKYQF